MSETASLAGVSFRRGYEAGPSAGGWPCVQLWNPPDSGIDGFLHKCWTYQSHASIAWSVRLKLLNAPLLNPVAPLPPLKGKCTRLGFPDGKLEVRFYCIPVPSTPEEEAAWGEEVEQQERGQGWVNGTWPTSFEDPLILAPGQGVLWMGRAAEIILRANFAWRERPHA